MKIDKIGIAKPIAIVLIIIGIINGSISGILVWILLLLAFDITIRINRHTKY